MQYQKSYNLPKESMPARWFFCFRFCIAGDTREVNIIVDGTIVIQVPTSNFHGERTWITAHLHGQCFFWFLSGILKIFIDCIFVFIWDLFSVSFVFI